MSIGNAFSSKYIEHKSKGNKDKNLPIKEYLDMIKTYLSDIINDHKTQGEWRIHSDNTIGECKIQLTMAISLFLLKKF